MSVYVDNMRATLGRMKMCHMVADTTEELLAMVDLIGVDRKWIQNAGTRREHFDIALSKRALAVRAGAVEIDLHELSRVLNRKRIDVPPVPDMSRTEQMLIAFREADELFDDVDSNDEWQWLTAIARHFVSVAFWLDTQHVNSWSQAGHVSLDFARDCVTRWKLEQEISVS